MDQGVRAVLAAQEIVDCNAGSSAPSSGNATAGHITQPSA